MKSFTFAALAAAVSAQQVGYNKQEYHLPLNLGTCTTGGGCSTELKSVVMDANWRWVDHNGTNCYTGNEWNTSFCPDPDTCAENCALEGVPESDWSGTYGVRSTQDALNVGFVTYAYGKNVGSRMYMLNTESSYQMFYLKN